MAQKGSVLQVLIGPQEYSDEKGEHYHCFVEFKAPCTKYTFPDEIITQAWLKPLEVPLGVKPFTAKSRYMKYCCKENDPIYTFGVREIMYKEDPDPEKREKMKASEQIVKRIAEGDSRKRLLADFPACHQIIYKQLENHPRKYTESYCQYIWGGTGVGKTTAAKRVLNWFRQNHGLEYYTKMGGISRFFDGYDWEPIILLDDPVEPKKGADSVDLAAMKNLINEHERFVEIKGSSMPFDSKLIIITSNISPVEFAMAFGNSCFEAIKRRLDGDPQAVQVDVQDRDRLTMYLIKIVAEAFDIYCEPAKIFADLEPVNKKTFKNIVF